MGVPKLPVSQPCGSPLWLTYVLQLPVLFVQELFYAFSVMDVLFLFLCF